MRYNDALKEVLHDRNKKFILTGEESYLKEQFERYLISKHPEATILSYYPGDEQDVKNSLYTSSIFDDRIIILHYLDQMKNKDLPNLIKDYDGYLLIILSDNANVKTPVLSSIVSNTLPVLCNKMSEYGSDYPSWISSHGSEKGYTFVDSSEEHLYQKVGPDLTTILNEMFKLMLYKQDTKIIYPDDVKKVVASSAAGSAFDVLDNLLKKDVSKTLKSIDSYFQCNEDPIELVWFLGRYFEKLYRLLLMSDQKISPEGMADILGMPAMLVKTRYLPKSKALGKEFIGKWIEKLCLMDFEIRSFKGDKKILISNFIINLILG